MNLLEWILFIVIFLVMALHKPLQLITKRQITTITLSIFLLALLQLSYEGYKWQVFPLYILVVMLMIVYHVDSLYAWKDNKIVRSVLWVLLIVSGLSTVIFPEYKLPTPTGQYEIGTTTIYLEDTRLEEFSQEEGDYRRFMIQMWYPAETTEGYEQVPWLQDGLPVARGLADDMNLPFFVLDHTVQTMSNSYLDAPLSTAKAQYPVVIISHGWRGFRNLHNDFAEELASQGYIVVAIDHTYGSVATVFDDTVINVDLNILPSRETTPNFLAYANTLVYTYAGDVSTTIDYLEDINSTMSTFFYNRLDLNHIGLLGHSTGGGADAAVALEDSRVTALFGLDSWVEAIAEPTILNGLEIPSVFVRSGQWEEGYNNQNLYLLINNSTNSILYQIDGTTHYDFAMVYMYSPLVKTIGFSGDVNSEELTDILKTMMIDFFDNSLKNNSTSTIDTSQWDEVRQIPTN